ncbi:Transcriptional regulator, MarR family [hydrothermal vent metagenome]|uniref:Transcriptional regulator, MarR family n=1 Tax=hydrothermal vent metagenome TaxID=652676 RepID=A0A1W1EBG1_9ZZZZ
MKFNMDESLGFILNRTAISTKMSFNKLIKSHGISPEQWSIIFRVVEKNGINQKELADSTYKDQGNLTRMIDKLVEKGYLIRKLNETDRRAFKLLATDKSKLLVENVVPISNLYNEQLTKDFTENEKVKLIELLNKVYNNIQKD